MACGTKSRDHEVSRITVAYWRSKVNSAESLGSLVD